MPHALLLLSPSCDVSSALPDTLSSNVPRPNASTDYLVDTPGPRALLQRTFLGFPAFPQPDLEEEQRLMELVHSEYVSPCSPRVLKRWGHDVKQDMEGKHEEAFRRKNVVLEAARVMAAKVAAKEASLDMDAGKNSTTNSVYSPSRDGSKDARNGNGSDHVEAPGVKVAADRSQFKALFEGFPRTLIVVGDAERLVTEIKYLQDAMKKDGVDAQAEWVRDAVHDILLISQWWWDWGVVDEVWRVIGDWAARVKG